MIEKFIRIKNIGRFRSCNPLGDVTLRKLSLLFAENGRGKTTLCAILRSLQSGQATHITERRTLGSTQPPTACIRLGGSNFTFANDAWSATFPDIAIFDSAFIHDNVYAGDYVDHEHKKNLYRVIVGDQGVQLARQIEGLDDNIRDANANIRTTKDALSRFLPNGTTTEAYLAWQPVQDVDDKIQQTTLEITARQHALDKAAEINTKPLLAKIALPTLPGDLLTVLAKQLSDIEVDAENRVRQQIASHNMGRQGETWLSQGVGFVAGNDCPFCGSAIDGNALIAAYRSHFSVAYNDLKREVANLAQRIRQAIGDVALNSIQATCSSNLALLEFWRQFCRVDAVGIDYEDVRAKYSALRDVALALAQQKQQTPTEPIHPGNDFDAARTAAATVEQLVATYNASIDAANALITQQKTATQQGQDINVLKAALRDLEAKKQRFTPEAITACQDYDSAVTAKSGFEQQKAATRQQLDQYCQQILQAYESSINCYLDQFNAGFRIANSRHLYTGGTPSSHYQLIINNNAVDLGDSRTRPGTPCFKTTLSSGDRSALALAFFLAALKQDHGIANKIVVLDDPFTSQDRFRRTCTQQLIRLLAGAARQVILLSHDPGFLRLVWEGYAPADIKVLQLCMIANTTTIAEWDVEAETQSAYMKNYASLLAYYRDRIGTPLDVARSIRPFAEGMLRSHFPGRFMPSEWLGDFIGKIRAAQATDGLCHAQADLSELEAINDYSKKYHHDQNPNADAETISADELHGFVKRTLRLVGGA